MNREARPTSIKRPLANLRATHCIYYSISFRFVYFPNTFVRKTSSETQFLRRIAKNSPREFLRLRRRSLCFAHFDRISPTNMEWRNSDLAFTRIQTSTITKVLDAGFSYFPNTSLHFASEYP